MLFTGALIQYNAIQYNAMQCNMIRNTVTQYILKNAHSAVEERPHKLLFITNFVIVSFNGYFEICHTRAVTNVEWQRIP